MRITYTQELEPLGTIGPLSLLREHLDAPFLVLNGDVLTDLNLNQFISSHRRNHAALTIATANRPTKMDFGVIDETDGQVTGFREKPELSHLVSMGIYCMDPTILERIPSGVPFGFDDLGFNYRMDELRAALGLAQLRKLPEWNDIRRRLSLSYRQLIAEHCPSVMVPFEALWPSAHHLIPVVLPTTTSRQHVIDRLRKRGIRRRFIIHPCIA
jgi:NDP-sugar pyrophosphorylase family protein